MAHKNINDQTLSGTLERLSYLEKASHETKHLVGAAISNLVGPQAETGEANADGQRIRPGGFIGDAHRLIDQIERVLRDTHRHAQRIEELTRDRRNLSAAMPPEYDFEPQSGQDVAAGTYTKSAHSFAA